MAGSLSSAGRVASGRPNLGRADRVRLDADGPRRQLRPVPRAWDDDDVRQPGLNRAADARRFPGRLPLRARPAGGGRGRDGRRLRAGLRPHHPRQPAHRPRARQRDGGDLQRAGQPLAAADHRRPAGSGADHPAGESDQPRRGADAPPAGQVGLRAAARAGRPARPGARRPPGLAAAEGPRLRLAADGRLVRRGRGGRRPRGDRADGERACRRRPRGGRALAERLDDGAQPGLRRRPRHRRERGVGRRGRARRAPAPAGLGHPGDRAAGGSASPRTTPTSAACCRRRSAPSPRPSRATT